MKYSITRALAERKVLIKRHEKAVKELDLIAVQRGSRLMGGYSHIKPEDFINKVKEAWQSVLSLETRIDAIKNQIDRSNLVTTIKIGSKEMTIQEAIVMKNSICLKKDRLTKMKQSYRQALSANNDALEENRRRVEKTVADNTAANSGKVDPELEKQAVQQIESLYGVKFIDPLSLETMIKQLESEIEEFESNVDYALSESNSQTFIEIPD
jgi:ferredoxin-fold anticodon binding domain-containing protein